MTGLTRSDRQKIIDDFIERHGGYSARGFMEEVRASGGQHPAWTWFTWDDQKAADEYRVWEARNFVRDLRIIHSVETIKHGNVTVRQVEAPAAFSPTGTKEYIALDPDDPVRMAAFCREAERSLSAWLRRYRLALVHAGGSAGSVEKQIAALDKIAATVETDEAA